MPDDLKAKTIRGVGWSAVQNWTTRLVSFVVYPILARLLGPEAYGLIALAGTFTTVLDIFSDTSFGAAIEQRKDLRPEHVNAVFWVFLGAGIVLTTISIVVAPQVGVFFREPALPPVIRWLSLGFFLQMISGVQTSLLRRDLRIKALTTQSLTSATSGSLVGIVMAFAGCGVWSLVGQLLTIKLVSAAMLWRLSPWRPQRQFAWRDFREVSRFGFSVMGNRALSYLNQRLDQLLVGRFLGTVPLGLYFNAHKLKTLATNLLIGTYSQVAMPAFAKLQDDLPRFRAAFNKACRFITLVAFPAFTCIAVLAEELILVVLGEEWRQSAPVLQMLSLAGVVLAVQYVNGAAMMAVGRADMRLLVLAAHGIANTIGFLIAVRHGIVAVAAAYTIRAYLLAPLDTWVNSRLGAVSARGLLKAIRVQALATVVMGGALWYARTTIFAGLGDASRLFASGALGLVIYAGLVTALDRTLWRDCLSLGRHLKPDRHEPPDLEPR